MLGIEFAEQIMWKKKVAGVTQKKLESPWRHGMFLGVKKASGEMVVADEDGKYVVCRTVKKLPDESKWKLKGLDWVRFVPWNLGSEDREADGDGPATQVQHGPGVPMTELQAEEVKTKPVSIREPKMYRRHFEEFGSTGAQAVVR